MLPREVLRIGGNECIRRNGSRAARGFANSRSMLPPQADEMTSERKALSALEEELILKSRSFTLLPHDRPDARHAPGRHDSGGRSNDVP